MCDVIIYNDCDITKKYYFNIVIKKYYFNIVIRKNLSVIKTGVILEIVNKKKTDELFFFLL
jgi:hypothetical protein